MCYSAQVESKWKRYVREMEARWDPACLPGAAAAARGSPRTVPDLPRGFDRSSQTLRPTRSGPSKALVERYRKEQVTKLEAEIFAQRKRLADAERKLG